VESLDQIKARLEAAVLGAQGRLEEVEGAKHGRPERLAGEAPPLGRPVVAWVVDPGRRVAVVDDPQVGPDAVLAADVDRGLQRAGPALAAALARRDS